MFGPAQVPLLLNGSLEVFVPSLWADWSQYGITLQEVSDISFNGKYQALVVKSQTYELSPRSSLIGMVSIDAYFVDFYMLVFKNYQLIR